MKANRQRVLVMRSNVILHVKHLRLCTDQKQLILDYSFFPFLSIVHCIVFLYLDKKILSHQCERLTPHS